MNRNVNNSTLLGPHLEYFYLSYTACSLLHCCGVFVNVSKIITECINKYFFKYLLAGRFCSEICTSLCPEQECISIVMYWWWWSHL